MVDDTEHALGLSVEINTQIASFRTQLPFLIPWASARHREVSLSLRLAVDLLQTCVVCRYGMKLLIIQTSSSD